MGRDGVGSGRNYENWRSLHWISSFHKLRTVYRKFQSFPLFQPAEHKSGRVYPAFFYRRNSLSNDNPKAMEVNYFNRNILIFSGFKIINGRNACLNKSTAAFFFN
ncbi:MAG: hypothetical protein C4586_00675 [Anaerolineaceae bacterium]|nr:MAG: hypothetical protein C4586_00675 [Anaerolineaceae bacterium]